VLIGDRNFGVFSVAWHAHKCGHKVLVRLSEPRAGKLNGGSDPGAGTDRKVTWQPGAGDRRGHRELTGEERVEGRLIAIFSEEAMEILYLFTTLEEETAETVAALYKERWHIETDLRSLKEQVRLHTIPARSPELIACELLNGHCLLQPDSRVDERGCTADRHRTAATQLLALTGNVPGILPGGCTR